MCIGEYRYTAQLATLDKMQSPVRDVHKAFQEIVTPLQWQMWDSLLATHPDQRFRRYIIEGIRNGFKIGFDYSRPLRSAGSNMASTRQMPGVIRDYLAEECALGRVVGPLPRGMFPEVHVSRFGLIPKKAPGEWRLIVDLSAPEGRSVNDGVYEDLCSLKYATVDDALVVIAQLGQGTILAKVDVQKAYRNVPIFPADRLLLGMVWDEQLYVDTALPFGLRSAPKIFTALADAAEWIARQHNVSWIMHYLDDFLILGPPNTTACQANLSTLLTLPSLRNSVSR